MNKREEKALIETLQPMANIVRDSFIKAIVCRCNVHQCMAIDNGAEPEDYGPIIALAIESAQPITQRWLDEVAEIEKGQKLGERL